VAFLRHKDVAKKLFEDVAPLAKERQGGYCRITKLGVRMTDSAPMAVIEWVDQPEVAEETAAAPAAKGEENAPVEVETTKVEESK
jgi:large subunit ribosomal protein L17